MTWLLVGDAAKAQFYSISAVPLRVKKVPSGTLKSTRKTTHGPEHQPDSLHSAQTSNGRGAHQRHEDVFVEHIAAAVDTAAREHEFDDLIVVLPPKALAHFRKVVTPEVEKKIKQEIHSDWTHLTIPAIEKHLATRLP